MYLAPMSYYAITIPAPQELRDVLVALLSDMGYEGFEERPDALVAFIPEADFEENNLQGLVGSHGLDYTKEKIGQANWNAIWESSFEPVLVEDFCGIRAGFHAPLGDAVAHEIIITPKMSFGTGHHATTYSMVKLMRDVDFKGKRVFDFGSGTGILAILADKLGAVETRGSISMTGRWRTRSRTRKTIAPPTCISRSQTTWKVSRTRLTMYCWLISTVTYCWPIWAR